MHNPSRDILTRREPSVQWLIPDLLPYGSIVQYAGDPGVGKSFFCYTLAMCVATQSPFLGYIPTSAAPILYFDMENSEPDWTEYMRWVWRGLGTPDLSFIDDNLWTSHHELNDKWSPVVEAKIKALQPALVIFDTADAAFSVKDENDNAEASSIITRLRVLQKLVTPSPAMIILRHTKRQTFQEKGEPRRPRGASAWKGATDATWLHMRGKGSPSTKDGLRLYNTHVKPDKVRAFGLKDDIWIEPKQHGSGDKKGVSLIRGKSQKVAE